MVCCCLPCLHYVQKRLDPVPGSGPFTLCVTEIIRWLCIVIPVYLSIWRYADIGNLTLDGAFWGILTGSVLGFSLFIYLPLKVLALRYRVRNNKLKDYRWRPSILTYIILCAFPCMTLILIAIKSEKSDDGTTASPITTTDGQETDEYQTLDPITTTVLQVMVLGLTITEWMSKLREEHLTFDLITAMTVDFFFAYDVIQFIMLSTYDSNIYNTDWVYVCFVFAFVAMFRYVPAQPLHIRDKGSSVGAAVCIVVSMTCVDIPFLIVRLSTMIQFGLVVSDIIHPTKNIAMICFGTTQLYIIYVNRRSIKKSNLSVTTFQKQRELKTPLQGTWDLSKGDMCVRQRNGSCVDIECTSKEDRQEGTGEHENGGLEVIEDLDTE